MCVTGSKRWVIPNRHVSIMLQLYSLLWWSYGNVRLGQVRLLMMQQKWQNQSAVCVTGWKKMSDSQRTRFHYVAAPFFIVMIIWWAASAVLCCHTSQLGFHKKALRENQSLYWEHYDEIPKRTLHNSILIIVTAVRRRGGSEMPQPRRSMGGAPPKL